MAYKTKELIEYYYTALLKSVYLYKVWGKKRTKQLLAAHGDYRAAFETARNTNETLQAHGFIDVKITNLHEWAR
ncbi:hypothetical protein H257_18699 [Aphanomyces astaci]|uniref:Uncharacterized protein n=1 Tax=Aphanomyces astaci TaxID=112090 RepID=W4FAB6_APHAT|nr:hypothetical protein H257_18699 [Aphanomyces astaci]ETV64402.1 hypothetical protein H257_18699 [Aphanomyces astaci]|eukprot:XP_009846118.1 hypothetical protein H257_18699 [Aphanomyces astaci]